MDNAATLLAGFDARVVELQQTFDDASRAFSGGALKVSSRASVAELLMIQVLADFEQFAADLFYSCALGVSGISDVAPQIPVSTEADLDTLIFSHRREKYLTWLPFGDSLGRAENYLSDGRPFTRLKYRDVELRFLGDAMIIRNAIAHASAYATTQFKVLATSRSYPSTRPADFLLSTRGSSTEIELTFAGLRVAAQGLCAADEKKANSILNPERPFSGSSAAPPSDYACTDCGNSVHSHIGGKLGACPRCGRAAPCPNCGKQQGSSTWRRII